jgi:hypothetical protein
MGGCFGCGLWVVYRAMLIGANGQLAAKLLAIDNDCGLSGFARRYRLGVWVFGHGFDLPNVAALHRSGSLLFGIAPTVLDLDKSWMGGNLPV